VLGGIVKGVAMGSERPFTARIESLNGVAKMSLKGELDLATAPILTDQLARVEGEGVAEIILDLSQLTFLDGSGLRALLAGWIRAEMNGHCFMVGVASQPARHLLELAGALFLLDEREAVSVSDLVT
jgi:anti-sigma B factor antagonist